MKFSIKFISPTTYRKILTITLLSHQIPSYAITPSILISALVSTITTSIDVSTNMIEKERGKRSGYIYPRLSFCVDNMTGVYFLSSKGKFVTIDDSSNRLLYVLYFTLRSIVCPHNLDLRVFITILTSEFSLNRPHSFTVPSTTSPVRI